MISQSGVYLTHRLGKSSKKNDDYPLRRYVKNCAYSRQGGEGALQNGRVKVHVLHEGGNVVDACGVTMNPNEKGNYEKEHNDA
jgi:hypothetical protein